MHVPYPFTSHAFHVAEERAPAQVDISPSDRRTERMQVKISRVEVAWTDGKFFDSLYKRSATARNNAKKQLESNRMHAWERQKREKKKFSRRPSHPIRKSETLDAQRMGQTMENQGRGSLVRSVMRRFEASFRITHQRNLVPGGKKKRKRKRKLTFNASDA